jgi:lysozyme
VKVSSDGRRVLEYFEGRRNDAYPDPATGGEPITIGVGHTGPEVRLDTRWTDEQIEEALSKDLDRFEHGVEMLTIGRNLTQGQFDALVLFAFNVGIGNLTSSTLLRKLMAGELLSVTEEFARWDKAAGKSMKGLRRRRAAERELFNGATAATAIRVAQMTE